MNISDKFKQKKVVFSLEVFPPKKTSPIETIYSTFSDIWQVPSDFISVTYGAGGSDVQKNKTCKIASLLKSEYSVEPLAHLTCLNSDKEEIRLTLDSLKQNGISNVLALRGDKNPEVEPKNVFTNASDLVSFIKEYDSSFNVVGACYPEGHGECESLQKDVENLKNKIDAGVSHLITQLFFDNDQFFAFMDRLEKNGIDVPVEAGIMPIINKAQIERTVTMCGASLPRKFSHMISRYASDPLALRDAGIAYATQQIIELVSSGVQGIHLYTMNNIDLAIKINENIRSVIRSANKEND
ncbi:MAG: methylenetetrahydrofolate reductase [NAD(P)H] [Clostridiales bacterium]|nr:MAG: methylenetetrahydrofolate reductase [NAD(P)H] [Clostridiales bacterium]